jgi:hypothetical protein
MQALCGNRHSWPNTLLLLVVMLLLLLLLLTLGHCLPVSCQCFFVA